MIVNLVSHTLDPLSHIEEMAAICYDSEPSSSGAIMKNCYRNGHHSVLEHAAFTFHVYNVSRALMAQLTRHRVASFSIRSQRYCDEGRFEYVTPDTVHVNDAANKIYDQTMKYLSMQYRRLAAMGVPKEDARYILPNGCCTEIGITMNLRELIHFCNERMCTRAQWEIRELANRMAESVIEVMPEAAEMLRPKCEKNLECPICPERHSCGRHPTMKDFVEDVVSHGKRTDKGCGKNGKNKADECCKKP